MAKPLNKRQPTSSVASILESSVGSRLTAPLMSPALSTGMPSRVMEAGGEKYSRTAEGEISNIRMIARQFSLTPRADRTVRLLIDAIAQGTGLELNQSELLRAMLHAAEQSLPSLPAAAADLGMLKRPRNDRDRQAEQASLEEDIAAALLEALRCSFNSSSAN